MRVLVGQSQSGSLEELYAAPSGQPWLRVNMVSTVDGAATGDSGTSRSINNAADKEVFDLLRRLCDVVIVGAGTLRIEGYEVGRKPMVVVTRSAAIPPTLADAPRGHLLMATTSTSPGLEAARDHLGEENVMVLGSHRVDLARMRAALVDRGFVQQLCEGGPHLLRDLLDQGCVDELDATIVPRMVGGTHLRITDGAPIDVPLSLHTLIENDQTLLARWLV